MRIAYLNTFGIPARYRGTETCVEEIATRLVKRGHDVTVYCASDSTGRTSSYQGVRLISVRRSRNRFLDYPLRAIVSTLDAMSRDFDILHYYNTDSAFFTIVPRALSRKVVMSLDGPAWNRSSYPISVRTVLWLSSWPALYVPQATTVDSMYVREWYRSRCGKAPIFIPYGAKVSPRGSDPKVLRRFGLEADKYLLFVGALIPEKGVHYLIQAFDGIESRFQLVIVGSDPYDSSYERWLRKLSGSNVRFLGRVYGSEMENLFKGAYLYVSASESEGTSPALLSAMGYGNCVLVSDIPENLETIGDAGISFRNKDFEDLRKKIRLLLSNADIVEDHRKKAVDRVTRSYSWDSIANHMEKVYLSLTKERS
jgi:glycosyltransferase involved in cell wall biosynthesis